jgi:hypothetical protein
MQDDYFETIDIVKLRRNLGQESLGAYFGGGFGGSVIEYGSCYDRVRFGKRNYYGFYSVNV